MLWLLIIVIVIIAAFAMPRFGITLLGLIGLIVAGLIIFYFAEKQQENLSKTLITANQVELSDLILVPRYSSESYELQGRVKNKSTKYTLGDLRIKITMQDCVKPQECEVVGESTAWIYNDVPPGQMRNLNSSVYFSGLPKPRGKHEWHYLISEIKGK